MLFTTMRVCAVLCIILYTTQLSWAAPSSLSNTHNKRSHSVLSGILASRSSSKTCKLRPMSQSNPTSQSNSTSQSNPTGQSHVASSWYASWHSNDLPLSDVSWSKYTSVTYAFA